MFTPKKSLGQNFLKNERILNKIIETADIKKTDTVLEIGPGLGTLTKKLLQKALKVVAIEKDHRLIVILQETFKNDLKSKKLTLINEDILNLVTPFYQLLSTDYKLVSNIPYYLTGQIFRKFMQEEKVQPEKMVLLVQKEVAQRIVAQDRKENLLSLSVKAYGAPKIVEKVPARFFSPRPKVDSAILLINNISKDFFIKNNLSEELFFKTIKRGFAHKRKTLAKNLGLDKNILTKLNLPEKVRAEDLSLSDWLDLLR